MIRPYHNENMFYCGSPDRDDQAEMEIELAKARIATAEKEYQKQTTIDQPPLSLNDHGPESVYEYRQLYPCKNETIHKIYDDTIGIDFTALMRMKKGKRPARYSGSITSTLNNLSESFGNSD